MRIFLVVIFVIFPIILLQKAEASDRRHFTVQTAGGEILVESFPSGESGSHPAVLILSGSKGFGAAAYREMVQTFNAAGLDAYYVHILSPTDLTSIVKAGNAQARIRYYATRQLDWTAAVRGVVSYVNVLPDHAGKVGLVGISLGAQIAASAAADSADINALVLVDGGFPQGYSQPIRALPPLHLIWGEADQTFPLSVGQELLRRAQRLGGQASLDVYKNGAHDFFLKSGASQARAAHQSAADYLASRLKRKS
ncbi:hypothetical protein GCM10010520_59770 [Rhizobium viscosum]|uniref:Dienelactone hydrolase n=1 Tax=Rhizobium viscosum TaxID=1673 RepID=A0ABR9ITL0_RHIVS|nr:dienelactone hydrolase family protein [Rhizobium viscosum]MBE1506532.1 dienelactone hydrolase [Rhizobium viscosum]